MDIDMRNKDDGEDKSIVAPNGNGREYDRDRARDGRDRDYDYERDRDRRDRDRDRERREPGKPCILFVSYLVETTFTRNDSFSAK
jgi:hypothetical protein